ncbi:5'/3'-nucleotidase SurE, partial [Chlamydia psittaci C6/98]
RKFFSLSDCQIVIDEDISDECRTLLENYISVVPLLVRNSPLALTSEAEFQQLQEDFDNFMSSESGVTLFD